MALWVQPHPEENAIAYAHILVLPGIHSELWETCVQGLGKISEDEEQNLPDSKVSEAMP